MKRFNWNNITKEKVWAAHISFYKQRKGKIFTCTLCKQHCFHLYFGVCEDCGKCK